MFNMKAGDSIQAAENWDCIPPMPIHDYVNPNPDLPDDMLPKVEPPK